VIFGFLDEGGVRVNIKRYVIYVEGSRYEEVSGMCEGRWEATSVVSCEV
jgi:hypothetical protein